jgi:translation elongation factor EF-4
MKTGEVTELKLNDIQVEFPKINERYLGRKCKYGYISLYHPEVRFERIKIGFRSVTLTPLKSAVEVPRRSTLSHWRIQTRPGNQSYHEARL